MLKRIQDQLANCPTIHTYAMVTYKSIYKLKEVISSDQLQQI